MSSLLAEGSEDGGVNNDKKGFKATAMEVDFHTKLHNHSSDDAGHRQVEAAFLLLVPALHHDHGGDQLHHPVRLLRPLAVVPRALQQAQPVLLGQPKCHRHRVRGHRHAGRATIKLNFAQFSSTTLYEYSRLKQQTLV